MSKTHLGYMYSAVCSFVRLFRQQLLPISPKAGLTALDYLVFAESFVDHTHEQRFTHDCR